MKAVSFAGSAADTGGRELNTHPGGSKARPEMLLGRADSLSGDHA